MRINQRKTRRRCSNGRSSYECGSRLKALITSETAQKSARMQGRHGLAAVLPEGGKYSVDEVAKDQWTWRKDMASIPIAIPQNALHLSEDLHRNRSRQRQRNLSQSNCKLRTALAFTTENKLAGNKLKNACIVNKKGPPPLLEICYATCFNYFLFDTFSNPTLCGAVPPRDKEPATPVPARRQSLTWPCSSADCTRCRIWQRTLERYRPQTGVRFCPWRSVSL